ncbi:hypothetical protein [Flavobacterium sp.]|jgi:hypothetical protein|uniref:hypothetical protein n=1 Tax=Flavobacterium sp. TaxID=239 RepID=UPI0037C184FA
MKKFIALPLFGILSLSFINFNATDNLLIEQLNLTENNTVELTNVNQDLCYFGTGSWSSKKHVTSSLTKDAAKETVSASTRGTDCECKDKGEVVKDPTPTIAYNMSSLVQKYGA